MYRTCYIVQIVTFEIKEQDLPSLIFIFRVQFATQNSEMRIEGTRVNGRYIQRPR